MSYYPTVSLSYLVLLGWGFPDLVKTIEEENAHGSNQTSRQSEFMSIYLRLTDPPQSDTNQRTSTRVLEYSRTSPRVLYSSTRVWYSVPKLRYEYSSYIVFLPAVFLKLRTLQFWFHKERTAFQ